MYNTAQTLAVDGSYCSSMDKKRSPGSRDQPSFDELYLMYEELLRLRNDVEVEEAREHQRTAPADAKISGLRPIVDRE